MNNLNSENSLTALSVSEHQKRFKFVFLGEISVGKTSLITRFYLLEYFPEVFGFNFFFIIFLILFFLFIRKTYIV